MKKVMRMKILIIEDEYNLADAIKCMLETENYLVDIDTDGEVGLYDALSGIYDLIILDIMLPKKSGIYILKEVRLEKINVKVIMLTAKTSIEDKMIAFNSGADDYLTKPFHMDELLARVNLQLRRESKMLDNVMKIGDIKLDLKTLKLSSVDDKHNVNIIGKEFQLLEFFMNNPNQIISKEQIFNKIWGYDSKCEVNTLEAYVSFLRKKLKLVKSNIKIRVIRGMGYVLEVNDEKAKN